MNGMEKNKMEFIKVTHNKKQFLDLLLLADEQESMVDKYLDRGDLYILSDDEVLRTVCVTTDEGYGVLEIKNLATQKDYQRQGYAKLMIDYIANLHSQDFKMIKVGTGITTVEFYKKCGFLPWYIEKDFFIENYDHEIFEDGQQLIDMFYLKRHLNYNDGHN